MVVRDPSCIPQSWVAEHEPRWAYRDGDVDYRSQYRFGNRKWLIVAFTSTPFVAYRTFGASLVYAEGTELTAISLPEFVDERAS